MANKLLKRTLAMALALISIISLVPAMAATPEWNTQLAVVDGALNTEYIVYGGNWNVSKTAGIIDRAHTTDESNGSATISFRGTGLRIYAELNNQSSAGEGGVVDQWHNNDNVYITIDGGTPVKMNLVAQTHIYDVDYLVYETTSLSDSVHTAVINNRVHSGNPSNSGAFTLYSVSVLGEYVKWNTTNTVVDGKINDLITYDGYWNISDPISGTAKTVKTTIDENTASFDFVGEGVRIYAQVNNQDSNGDGKIDQWHNNNNVVISVDGSTPVKMNLTATTHTVQSDYLVYELNDLAAGPHNVVITTKLQQAPVASGEFALHSVAVANGELVKWDITSSMNGQKMNTDYFNFSKAWNVHPDGTGITASVDGETIDFAFTGTGVRIYAEVNNRDTNNDGVVETWHNNNNVTISIDGGAPVKMNLTREYDLYDTKAIVYNIAGLEDGYHTAEICIGLAEAPVGSGAFTLHSVGVLDGTMKKWVNYKAVKNGAVNTGHFDFVGGWDLSLGNAGVATSLQDSTASFKFNGTGVRVYAEINNQDSDENGSVDQWHNNNEVYISIDGKEPVKMNMTSETHLIDTAALVYEVVDLPEGEHTAVITNKMQTEPVTSGYFALDSVSIAEGYMIEKQGYNVTVRVSKGGSADWTTGKVFGGESLTVHFTPATGYEIEEVTVNGVSKGSVPFITLDSVTEDTEITVSFVNPTLVLEGWVEDFDGMRYYEGGVMVTSKWIKTDGKWYYVEADGLMVTNTWRKDSKGWCYLGSNGAMATNKWVKDSKGWCYVGKDGYCVKNTWKKDSKGWCYLGSDCRMVTNKWVKDSKGWCYVGSDGYAVTNTWKKDSVGWCYLDKNGSMTKSKWVKDGGKWYYLNSKGYMVTGTVKISGVYHKFKSNGVWIGEA